MTPLDFFLYILAAGAALCITCFGIALVFVLFLRLLVWIE